MIGTQDVIDAIGQVYQTNIQSIILSFLIVIFAVISFYKNK